MQMRPAFIRFGLRPRRRTLVPVMSELVAIVCSRSWAVGMIVNHPVDWKVKCASDGVAPLLPWGGSGPRAARFGHCSPAEHDRSDGHHHVAQDLRPPGSGSLVARSAEGECSR